MGYQIYKHEEDFFFRDTPETAYWCGFIAADGCISYNLKKSNKYSYQLTFCLAKKDEKHLEAFIHAIKYTGKLKYRTTSIKNYSTYEQVQLRITLNKEEIDILESKWSITERKSLTLKPPNIENKDLIYAFIKGYIDGDGCIRLTKKGSIITLSIVGTKSFLEWVKFHLNINSKITKDKNVYVLASTGQKIDKTLKLIDASIFYGLSRKWDIVKNYNRVRDSRLSDKGYSAYKIIHPDGTITYTENLEKFSREHGIGGGNLVRYGYTKGYRLEYKK